MSSADFLLTLAEISIAFVGFSAIVIVFFRFGSGGESRFQNLQVSSIIQIGLLAGSSLDLAGEAAAEPLVR